MEDTGVFGSWYADLLIVDRRNCLFFTNAVSLFSFVVLGVKRSDFVVFREFFLDRLTKALSAEDVDPGVVRMVIDPSAPLYVCRTSSKSVLGSMNDLSKQLKWLVQHAGGVAAASEIEIARELNRTPMSALGGKYPIDRLFKTLDLRREPDRVRRPAGASPRVVYQFRVTLHGVEPPIWRSIQVPRHYTFWDLHVAIQDAFGWEDRHLHEFDIAKPSLGKKVAIGIPADSGFELEKVLPGWKESIADYFTAENCRALYRYDFGDGWEHSVVLEETAPTRGMLRWPACLDGSRACPPEDCGGPGAYMKVTRDTKQAREFGLDPEHFSASEVVFDDPKERWHWSFNAAVLLDNELMRMMSRPPVIDRMGRVAFRVPLYCRDKILDQCFLDSELDSRFRIAPAKNGAIAVKLDEDDVEELLGHLAAAGNHAKTRLDQIVFQTLSSHFSSCGSILSNR